MTEDSALTPTPSAAGDSATVPESPEAAGTDPVVSPAWLAEHLDEVVVVDVTTIVGGGGTGHSAYEAGHVPGAVHADLLSAFSDADAELPLTALDSEEFAVQAGTLGIGDGDRVVVYDQGAMMWAARFWWNLRLEGHDAVHVLAGGLPAWRDAGHDVATGTETRPTARFTARRRAGLIADAAAAAHAGTADDHVLIDALDPASYTGAGAPDDGRRAGHIPGAVNLPAAQLARDGELAGPEDTRRLAEQVGALDEQRAPVTYCHGGVAASLVALQLARAGRWDVAVYDGSLTDWLRDPGRRLERGGDTARL